MRVWQALHELARSEAARGNHDIGATIEDARSVERALVHRQVERWIGARVAEVDVTRVCALAEGLRFQLVAPAAPIDASAVAALLRAELDELRKGCEPALSAGNLAADTPALELPYL